MLQRQGWIGPRVPAMQAIQDSQPKLTTKAKPPSKTAVCYLAIALAVHEEHAKLRL